MRTNHYLFKWCNRILALSFLFLVLWGCQKQPVSQKTIAITTKSEEARQLFLEGRQLFENLRFTEAHALFAQAMEKDPEFSLAHMYSSMTAATAMDRQKHLLQSMNLAENATDGEKMLVTARLANAHGNPTKEIEILEKLVRKFPGDIRALYFLASTYEFRNEHEKAIGRFKKIIEIDPDFVPTYNILGYAYRSMGDYQKSMEAFKNYIRLIPDEANPYDSMGDLLTKMGKFEEAIQNYEKAIELNKTFVFSKRKIGTNLIFMGKYDEARNIFNKAMALEQNDVGKIRDLRMMAHSYIYEGNYKEALPYLNKSIELATDAAIPEQTALSIIQKCRIYLETGQYDKAEARLVECLAMVMDSELSEAAKETYAKRILANAARILSKQKKLEKALAKAEEFKAKVQAGYDPKEIGDYHELLGHIYFDNGEYTTALEHFKKINQENPYCLYAIAIAELETGNNTVAEDIFKKVINWNEHSLNYAFVRNQAISHSVLAVK